MAAFGVAQLLPVCSGKQCFGPVSAAYPQRGVTKGATPPAGMPCVSQSRSFGHYILAVLAIVPACIKRCRCHGHRGVASLRAAQWREDTRSVYTGPTCGEKLQARIHTIRDFGIYCDSAGTEVYIPTRQLAKATHEYSIGMDLDVIVIRPSVPAKGKEAVMATDRDLKPLSSLRMGSVVDGTVLKVSEVGLLLDIGVPKLARCLWRHLTPLGKEPSAYSDGDVLQVKVAKSYPTWVKVIAKEFRLRPVDDLKVGEQLDGIVEGRSRKHGCVWFDVDTTRSIAGFRKDGQLAKPPDGYFIGEKAELTVVKVAKGKAWASDRSHP